MTMRDQSEGQAMNQAPSGAPPKMGGAQSRSIFSLSECLDRDDRHPILLFGIASSGKSTLILSIIRCLQQASHVDVELGAPILDAAHPGQELAHRMAKNFFERAGYNHDRGEGIEATQTELFIPIDVRPRDSRLPSVKFAFIDGRGEWYEPQKQYKNAEGGPENLVDMYNHLNDDIKDLLNRHPNSISIIYVAPCLSRDGRNLSVDSDYGLVGTIQWSRQLRRNRENDFHLFLLSKWDEIASPDAPNGVFDNVTPSKVEGVLRDRYPQSWGSFQGLPLEGPAADRRAFMQFSSGYYINGSPRLVPEKYRKSFDRYPRTVVNWLYGNATRIHFDGDEGRSVFRKILFYDVISPTVPRIALSDRLAALLASR